MMITVVMMTMMMTMMMMMKMTMTMMMMMLSDQVLIPERISIGSVCFFSRLSFTCFCGISNGVLHAVYGFVSFT